MRLQDMPQDLSVLALYRADLATLANEGDLSQEEKDRYVARARAGDTSARTTIIEHLLPCVLRIAFAASRRAFGRRVSVEDLISEGNETLMQHLSSALEHENPYAYLISQVSWAIRRLMMRHEELITTPETLGCQPYCVESLDAPLPETDGLTLLDRLQAQEPLGTGDQSDPTDHSRDLYQALDRLTPRQRTLVMRHWGLGENQAPETLISLKETTGSSVTGLYTHALQRLAGMLSPAYGFVPVKEKASRQDPSLTLTEAQQNRLQKAYAAMIARGESVTRRKLARDARVANDAARVYLARLRRNEPSRYERLEQAYQRLQANQTKPVRGTQLIQETHLSAGTVYAYLHSKRQEVYA